MGRYRPYHYRPKSICKICGKLIYRNTGIPRKRVHERCVDELPYDLIIQRGTSHIEVKTFLCSKKQLQKIAKSYITNYIK